MKQNFANNDSRGGKLVGQLTADKKKTVLAVGLIVVMIFMWIKAFGGKSPTAAGAKPITNNSVSQQGHSEMKITFVQLPKVEGRNDVLTRDFFAVDSWRNLIADKEGTGSNVTTEGNVVLGDEEEFVKEITRNLKLQAIGFGQIPTAFINDRSLKVADELLIRGKDSTYRCRIDAIEQNKVFIRVGDTQITLTLKQSDEAAD